MCDFDNDFEDVENDSFMDEDQCDDEFHDDEFHDDEFDSDTFGDEEFDESDETESENDDFTAKDAFFLGGAMGWAYEEGFQDAIRQRRMRKTKKKLVREERDR